MSSSLISQTDLKTIKDKNYRLIFCIGLPGSNKESQIEKVSNEFKFSKINVKELIDKEVSSDTDIGKKINESKSKGESIPSELVVSLLVHNIASCQSNTVLIDGFPIKLDDALYFEQNVMPIELILKFSGTDDTCLHNLTEAGDDSLKPEELKKIFETMNNDFKILENFYSPYSIVREIDINGKKIGEINTLMKQCLYPTIYSIIGKRYSGKSELSKVLEEKMGMTLLNFNEFLREPEIKERVKETEYVINKFILKLRRMQDIRVLVEDFPKDKEQYVYFINNCRPLEKIFYLNADNSSCLERLKNIPVDDKNYISCSQLDSRLYEFEQKDF